MLSRDTFFGAPTFSGRVQQTANAGIEISHVTTQESGNYSVEIIARDASGDLITIQRTVSVRVVGEYRFMSFDAWTVYLFCVYDHLCKNNRER